MERVSELPESIRHWHIEVETDGRGHKRASLRDGHIYLEIYDRYCYGWRIYPVPLLAKLVGITPKGWERRILGRLQREADRRNARMRRVVPS